jgi:hypothetical protein
MVNNTIVFDLDDTISFCHDRDWPNAKPNIDLIRKINKLYNEGWFIHIHSARGQLSGINYTEIVTKWLEDNGVLYHKLEFGKPLGVLYVDDKGINVNDFMNLEIEEFKSGWSGEKIIRLGNRVIKQDRSILESVRWYHLAGNYFNVPKILAVTGSQLELQYIKPDDKKPFATYDECKIIAKTFQSLNPVNDFKWKHYINWISGRVEYLKCFKDDDFSPILKELANMKPPERSFSHGDFTPDNTIRNRKNYIYLIDPRNVTYSSYELDLAKLDSWMLRQDKQDEVVINTLVISETIRVLKDAPEEMYNKLKAICLNYLKQ